MKKFLSLVFTLVCVLSLTACRNVKATYSFRGEHEYFTISNGSIVLSNTEEVFDGGDLEATHTESFKNVASYSTTFYTLINGERRTILTNSVIDKTGGSVDVNGDLGSVSGDDIIDIKIANIDEMIENLWFELKTKDLNGKENVYQIQLTLTE